MLCTGKKDSRWNPSTCICENNKYLKIISDDSKILRDEIISVMDITSTKMINTIATNVTKNCHSIKVRYKIDLYIFYVVLLKIILLLITTVICNHYANLRSKGKRIDALKYKMENNEFKNRRCYYFDDIIKLEGFDIDNI